MSAPVRRKPIVRKEVVPTVSWGELTVRRLKASQRLDIADVEVIEGEDAAARSRRVSKLFLPRLLHLAVPKTGTDEPLFTADEWDIELGSEEASELDPVIEKALDINGFNKVVKGPDGQPQEESAAKNG